ncbi:MAG: carboxylating nicotinate-nucleotide diphosphorylase [Planctomycetes bacterium]|nr:carboxylating nicotinate-nucleotide diphosphorylase [Planctomycetota bacterium]
MATAVADRVEFHEDLTPTKVDALKRKHNKSVRGDDAFWQLKRDSRYATFVTLREVKPITNADAPKIAPSRGIAWFVLRDDGQNKSIPAPAKPHVTLPAPRLSDFITYDRLTQIIRESRNEDLGPRHDDITSRLLVPESRAGSAVMRSRAVGVLSGAALLTDIAGTYDPNVRVESFLNDGSPLGPGADVARFSGPLRSILAIERVALNFCTHLSGIASATRRFVDEVAGTKAKIYDTRKTHPGLRELEKYAVACGGGCSHRMGLFDAVLVKDNHLAHVPLGKLASALRSMVVQARLCAPPPKFVMIEVDTLAQLREVLTTGPDIVLLDNMDVPTIRRAVELRDRTAPHIELEVSGGVRLKSVRGFAKTGVDRISVGALTHSAPALDLGLDIDA